MQSCKHHPKLAASGKAAPKAPEKAAVPAPVPAPVRAAAFETLEGRSLLSAVIFQDNVLTLTGDDGRSNILRVDYNGGGNVTAIANGVYRSIPKGWIKSVNVTGGSGIDRVRISKALNVPTNIEVGAGNDVVYGGAGPDTIYGGDGNDTLIGRAGKDKLIGGAGYDSLLGTRGIDIMFQGADTPAPTPPPTPPPAPEAPPPVVVNEFGAKGDGVTDDSPAIQSAIDAAPAGATVVFNAGTYLLKKGILITKPLTLLGNSALMKLDSPTVVRSRQFTVISRTDDQRRPWKQNISAGDQTLNVAVPQGELMAGDLVYIELGQDPYDPYMPNFTTVCRVVENTGSSVTIDRPVPYDIKAGALDNRISKVESLAHDVTIKGFRFDYTDGTEADAAVWVQAARNVQLEDLSGRSATFAVVVESQDVTLRNITSDVVFEHAQAGRLLSLWQTDRVQMFNSSVTTSADQPVVFLESWSRDTTIDGLQVDWNYAGTPQSNVLHFGNGSYGIFADNVVVRNQGPIRFVGSGGTPSEYSFGAVEVTGPVLSLPAYLTTRLTVGDHVMTEIAKVHKEVELHSTAGFQVPLVSGAVFRKMTVTLTNKKGVTAVIVQNALNQGSSLLADLQPNVPLLLEGSVGTAYMANDLDGSEKTLWVYTGAGVEAGTKITVDVEYYKLS